MTREDARQILESCGSIKVYTLTFYKDQVECEEGCCNDGFKNIDEALDTINLHEKFDQTIFSNLTEKENMQDNSWYEKGELPPVGIVCEFFIPEDCTVEFRKGLTTGSEVNVIAHFIGGSGNKVAALTFKVGHNVYVAQAVSACFRPIKSDREKAIEEMKKLVASLGSDIIMSQTIMFGALYDAGYRKADK